MKYGLMYYKNTDNIGDDIQTYAAMKFLPHIDYYIDRENLSCFVPDKKEYVSLIMNGWFIHNKLAWPPSPYINPLLISMHFKTLKDTDVGDMYLKGLGREFLQKFGPVGTRDDETAKRLEKNKIETYFSGCMTLTIEKFSNIKNKNKIYLVDVSDEVIKKVKESTRSEFEILTHSLDQKETEKKTINERMKEVEKLLKKYQEAKLVITTRLHAALPCVALGTPVIVLHKEVFDEDRLSTFFSFFTNYVEENFLEMDIKQILDKPKKNQKKKKIDEIDGMSRFSATSVKTVKKELIKRCKDFIRKCEKEKFDVEKIPSIEEYTKYAKRLGWYKDIYEKERMNVEKLEQKRIEEWSLYHKNLDELYRKYEN